MDAAYLLAKNLVTLEYTDIPGQVIEATKKSILDILGVALGGSSKPGVRELLEVVSEWGGKPESSVLSFGNKLPAPHAAQVNATMGHALDYDDTYNYAAIHPSVVIVPTCLAMAERRGKLSGREFLTAVAAGIDMICRLGLAFSRGSTASPGSGPPGAGWHLTTLYGFLAAAGVAGKIAGLNEDEIGNALGIAYHQCSGNGQCISDGALTKRMGPGFAAKGGITAAILAQKGITGARNCLEGEKGLYYLYHGGKYDPGPLTMDLGKRFEGINVSIKPYPCCRGTHSFINVALELAIKHGINAEDVHEITIFHHDKNYTLLSPLEIRCRPRNIVDAQFSIPWGIAVAFSRKTVAIADFTQEAILSPDILEMAAKIHVEEETVPAVSKGIILAKVRVITKEGQAYTEQAGLSVASPESPLPLDTYERKFGDCAAYAIKRLPDEHIVRIVDMVAKLEQLEDVTEIMELLS